MMEEEESLAAAAAAAAPHDALFLVLPYLSSLWELLSMSQVCVSLRDAVFRDDDLLPWVELVVHNPISRRLSDHNLLTLTSKAKGRLTTLALFDCFKVTDHALLLVVRNSPLIRKLYVPGCTSLTPEGVINAVGILSSSSSNNLKLSLKINGIYNMSKEHLQTLHKYQLLQTVIDQKHHRPTPNYLHQHRQIGQQVTKISTIDVEVCPRCDQVRMVFSCPKLETSSCRNSTRMEDGCRGCVICIPRCVECGGCIDGDEDEEEIGVCGDVLCLGCWLQLPKCNLCNRTYCKQHYSSYLISNSNSSEGFVCASCTLDDALILMGDGHHSDY